MVHIKIQKEENQNENEIKEKDETFTMKHKVKAILGSSLPPLPSSSNACYFPSSLYLAKSSQHRSLNNSTPPGMFNHGPSMNLQSLWELKGQHLIKNMKLSG